MQACPVKSKELLGAVAFHQLATAWSHGGSAMEAAPSATLHSITVSMRGEVKNELPPYFAGSQIKKSSTRESQW